MGNSISVKHSSVQSLSHVWLFSTQWIAAHTRQTQKSILYMIPFTKSQNRQNWLIDDVRNQDRGYSCRGGGRLGILEEDRGCLQDAGKCSITWGKYYLHTCSFHENSLSCTLMIWVPLHVLSLIKNSNNNKKVSIKIGHFTSRAT